MNFLKIKVRKFVECQILMTFSKICKKSRFTVIVPKIVSNNESILYRNIGVIISIFPDIYCPAMDNAIKLL